MIIDPNPYAQSHAGDYADFSVFYHDASNSDDNELGTNFDAGWYWQTRGRKPHMTCGPFHTSQAAFGDRKDAIDHSLLTELFGLAGGR